MMLNVCTHSLLPIQQSYHLKLTNYKSFELLSTVSKYVTINQCGTNDIIIFSLSLSIEKCAL